MWDDMHHIISAVLFSLSGVIIVCYCMRKYSNFIDVRRIVSAHLEMFRKNDIKRRWLKGQLLFFFGVPLMLDVAILLITPINNRTDKIIDFLMLIVTVLLSALLSIWSVIQGLNIDQSRLIDTNEKRSSMEIMNKRRAELLCETQNTILFEVFICVVILIVGLVYVFLDKKVTSLISYFIVGTIYYLTFVLVTNLPIILKRSSVLSTVVLKK
ncbi:Uncharacterised protein [Anaerotruncus sp. 2789STDY5834896]|uniref:Uncharacterized protein n=1 Tax=uncultured Anaerotruncus sp. TaxID=905011 RepID=A0A1C6FQ14_9FIRM|nr:Uncharacterised protein [uncultured Anaerotruncus sp.]